MRKSAATVEKPAPITATREVKAVAASERCHPAQNGRSESEDAIRLRAYLKWEAAGKPCCDGVSFWLEAERELRAGHITKGTS